MIQKTSLLLIGLCAPVLGFASVCIPVWLSTEVTLPAPLSPTLRTAIELSSPISLLLLFLSALLLGAAERKNPLFIGFAMVLIFPLIILFELGISALSHPSFTRDLVYCCIMGCSTIAGAYLGKTSVR